LPEEIKDCTNTAGSGSEASDGARREGGREEATEEILQKIHFLTFSLFLAFFHALFAPAFDRMIFTNGLTVRRASDSEMVYISVLKLITQLSHLLYFLFLVAFCLYFVLLHLNKVYVKLLLGEPERGINE
jgi:hypothetical protein